MTEEKKKRYVGLSGNIQIKSGMAARLPLVLPDIKKALDDFSKKLFGMSISEAKEKGICINCGLTVTQEFRSDPDYRWTGLCKVCKAIANNDKED